MAEEQRNNRDTTLRPFRQPYSPHEILLGRQTSGIYTVLKGQKVTLTSVLSPKWKLPIRIHYVYNVLTKYGQHLAVIL
jgi:hypothetical protein